MRAVHRHHDDAPTLLFEGEGARRAQLVEDVGQRPPRHPIPARCGGAHAYRPEKFGARLALKASSASVMSSQRVSSACPRFSSSSAAAKEVTSMLACNARLDIRMPPGELAQICFVMASVWSSRSSGPV